MPTGAAPARCEPDRVRRLVPSDAPACAALSGAVGWPHREQDWRMAIRLGDGLAVLQDRAIVATAVSWILGPSHAALGMIIVAPHLQGAGIGRGLMARLLAQTEGRAQLLTATEAGRPLYESVGFAACGTVHQHQGRVGGAPDAMPAGAEAPRSAGPADLDAICRIDAAATGLERGPILAALLDAGEAVALERGGEIAGFSIVRPFGRGEVIGPVVAPDAQAARRLIAHWLPQRRGRFLRVDLAAADELGGWLAGCGLPRMDIGVAMLRGPAPAPAGRSRRFALANQAMG